MLVAAFFPPTARVLGFASGIMVMLAFHYQKIMTINLVVQLAMYLSGGVSFLRYCFRPKATLSYTVCYWSSPALYWQLLKIICGVHCCRNKGHERWSGLCDHHFLHYFVTAACSMHVWYILAAMKAPEAA